jgi:hypothetical protein
MKSFKQYFLESKQVGVLYHYTSIDNAMHIIKENILRRSGSWISFTRDKHFHNFTERDIEVSGLDCCFVVDGDKLSENYKIQPFNYFWKNGTGPEGHYFHSGMYDEREERVHKDIENFKQYVIKLKIDKHSLLYYIETADYSNTSAYYLKLFGKYCQTEWMN